MKNKQLVTIFLIVFVDLLGFGIILPLLPFIGEKYGANAFGIGLLTATYSLFQFLSAPILGRMSDRYGRKRLLIVSQLGSGLGYVLLGVAGSMPLLFLSRIIDGATGGNISIAQAYIADITDSKDRARGMGVIGAAFGLGFIFGPVIGGLLSRLGYAAPAAVAAGIAVLTAAMTQTFLRETVNTVRAAHSRKTEFSLAQLRRVLSIHPIGILIITFFLINLAFSVMQGNFALYVQREFGYGAGEIGWMFTYIGVIAVLIQMRVLPYLLKRRSEKQLFLDSVLYLASGLFAFVVVFNPYLLVIPLTLIPLGNGLANPLIQSLSSKEVPKEEYGGTLGLIASAGSMGRILGPVLGGFVFYLWGQHVPFVLAAAILFLAYIQVRRTL